MSEIRGACLCGAVAFHVAPPAKWVAHCHCSMCRRAHGAPYVTWVGVPAEQVHVTAGEDALVRFASSAAATRRFCGRCGSPLFFESRHWPGEIHVARASLADDGLPAPMAHAFWDSRAPWVAIHDDLPKLSDPKLEDR